MQPDLNRLRAFYFVYSRHSIAAAAAALSLTPSAVSQQIQKLEREIKTPLFTRLHKRLVPTGAAQNLYDLVRPFIEGLDAGVRRLARTRTAPAGHLRIGAPKEFGKAYLPQIIGSFREDYPEVSFEVILGNPALLLPMVSQGRLDAACVDMFPVRGQMGALPAYFSSVPMIEEEVVLACSDTYYRRRVGRPHSAERLLAMDFISYRTEAAALRNWFRHHFGKSAPRLNVVLTVDSHQAVIGAIKAHVGLGVVASHLVREDIQDGRIVSIATRKKAVINLISLIRLADHVPGPAEKIFLSHFRDSLLAAEMAGPAFRVVTL